MLDRMKLPTLFVFLLAVLVPSISSADEITHSLGNAVYAVREARIWHADTKSPDHYRVAVNLLQKAQNTANKDEALHLAAEAEKEAQLALQEAWNK
ncbi:MAG: hypothetical protein HYU99_06315 [Deltaproteobacteria bacterium]|nr:hypothetical protein [Deltaproteobacteria bacterium]